MHRILFADVLAFNGLNAATPQVIIICGKLQGSLSSSIKIFLSIIQSVRGFSNELTR
jgi:hypothetical protein